MAEKRKVCETTLRLLSLYLEHWEVFPSRRTDYQELATDLIAECRRDAARGGEGPGPWLALADLIEECGMHTAIRLDIDGYYLPPRKDRTMSDGAIMTTTTRFLEATAYRNGDRNRHFNGRNVDSPLGMLIYALDCMEVADKEGLGDYRLRLYVGAPQMLHDLWADSAFTPAMEPEEVERRCVELWDKYLAGPFLPPR